MTTGKPSSSRESQPTPVVRQMPVLRAIAYATLVVGILDATDGVVFRGLHGQNPIQVLQFIASSLLGSRAFSGGLASATLGLLLHFAVSLAVAAIYVLASRALHILRTHWVILGFLYGAAVWVVMNLVILPFTAGVHGPGSGAALANGIIGHALFVGLPCGFFANKATSYSSL